MNVREHEAAMRTLLEYGLANIAAATAFAIVALVVGLVVRRPAVRNVLWILVFVRLLLPPLWTVPLSIAPERVAEEASQTLTNPEVAQGTNTAVESVRSVEVTPIAVTPELVETQLSEAASNPGVTSIVELGPEPPPGHDPEIRTSSILVPLLGWCWLVGSLFVFTRSFRRIMAFRRALKDASPAPSSIQQQSDSIARAMGLKRCPAVLMVPGRVWPSLWMPGLSVRHSKLIIPSALLPLLDSDQRTAVLAHELAHLRRGDPFVRWLELICCGVYWWFPLLGFFRRQLHESEEQCCDMWVVADVSSRKSYATALMETAFFLDGSASIPQPMLASGAGPVRNLQRRMTMIMRATWPARLSRLGLATVLGIGSLGLAFGPALAQPDRKEKDRPDPRVGDKERPGKDRPPDAPPKERDRPDGPPRERDRPREVGGKEVEEARAALEKARTAAREAMTRVQEAEARLAKLEGRPVPPAGRGPFERGPGDRGPGDRGPGDREPGRNPPERGPDRPPVDAVPRRPGVEGPRGGGDLRELQDQIQELRRALEEMRNEMKRGGPGRGPDPKDDRRGPGGPGGPGGVGGGPGAPGAPGAPGRPGVGGPGRPPVENPLPPKKGNERER